MKQESCSNQKIVLPRVIEKLQSLYDRNTKTIIGIIVLLGVLILDIAIANFYKIKNVERGYRISSEIYHHDLKKSVHVESVRWGDRRYSVSTDSLGFKSEKVQDTSPTIHDYRILFIGDSFTEGIGVEYSKTFVGIISNELSREHIDVLNAGVSSYSPSIYWRKTKYLIEEVGLRFNELIVLVDISDIQDEALFYQVSEKDIVVNKPAFKADSMAEKWARFQRVLGSNSIIFGFFLADEAASIAINRSGWTVNRKMYDEYGKAGLEKASFYMEKLHKLLQAHGVKMTVAVYPWPEQITHDDLNSIQVAYWREWSGKRNVCFLNYFPYFVKVGQNGRISMSTIDRYFINGDVHWNENGHKQIATVFISEYWRSRKCDFQASLHDTH